MVDLSIAMLVHQRVNIHFPMVFLWFSYGFPMVFSPIKHPPIGPSLELGFVSRSRGWKSPIEDPAATSVRQQASYGFSMALIEIDGLPIYLKYGNMVIFFYSCVSHNQRVLYIIIYAHVLYIPGW